MRVTRLSRRKRQLLRKFRMGYTAWCIPTAGFACLIPGPNVIGRQERVRVDTLEQMTQAGYLTQTQDAPPSRDVHWKLRRADR